MGTGDYLNKRKRAFGYALNGIRILFRDEAHARIHALAAVVAITAGVLLSISGPEWCAVLICIGMVTAAEGFNTAIEALADRVSPELHPLVAKCKDVAAGAVLILAIMSVAVAMIVFIPKLSAL